MDEDISIKLNPYMASSKNFMEFFFIIGYEESIIKEYVMNNNLLENEKNLKLTLISSVESDLAYNVFDSDIIINKVYPDPPKIIKITKSEEKP